MRIALISDTHVPQALPGLPEDLIEKLQGVDRILHAGDLANLGILERLCTIAPTTAVAGNIDPPEVKTKLHDREVLKLAGRTIGLAHGHQPHRLQDRYIGCDYDDAEFDLFYQTMADQLPNAEIIVFGHFHVPVVKNWNGIQFINPGSIAPPHTRPTFAMLELGDDVDVRIVELGNNP